MSSDILKDEKIKDSLDTCLNQLNLTVNKELLEKTLNRINNEDNLQEDKFSKHDLIGKQGRNRIKVASNLAAAVLILVVGVASLNILGNGKSKSTDMATNDSAEEYVEKSGTTADVMVESEEMLTMAGDEDGTTVENDAKMDQRVESFLKDSNTESADATSQIMTEDTSEIDHSDNYDGISPINEEMMNPTEANGVMGLVNSDLTFSEISAIIPEEVQEIQVRNVKGGADQKVTDDVAINELFGCMEQVQYVKSNSDITDPLGWDYVLEIKGNSKSFTIWIGSYIMITEVIDNEENSTPYEATDIKLLIQALNTYYKTIE